MEFVKGKWYTSSRWDKFYVLCDMTSTEKLYTQFQISNLIYKKEDRKLDYMLNTYTEVSSSIPEIQQCLPANHPDLILNYSLYPIF